MTNWYLDRADCKSVIYIFITECISLNELVKINKMTINLMALLNLDFAPKKQSFHKFAVIRKIGKPRGV